MSLLAARGEPPVTAVWYVAYGSNLAVERFRCYLAGGRPAGGVRHYTGCRDPRPPRADRRVTLPGGIFFAHTSRVWGGGMAFYDPELPGETAARAYLLSLSQFTDVLAQEMHRDVGAEADLDEALSTGRQRLGPGRYKTVLRVVESDGCPMLTFTAPQGAGRAELNAPSAAYLSMLGRGLAEPHGWKAARCAAYLGGRPGARAVWSGEDITALFVPSPGLPPRGLPHGPPPI